MRRIRLVMLALLPLTVFLVLPVTRADAALPSVCAGAENLPYRAVKVNDLWDSTGCGNPATFTLNVWEYAYPTNVPPGGQLQVCAGWRPDDAPDMAWRIVASHWDPNKCGHPSTYLENIWVIQRIY